MWSSMQWHTVRWSLFLALIPVLPSCGPAKIEPVVATIFVPLNAKSEEHLLVDSVRRSAIGVGCVPVKMVRHVPGKEGCDFVDGSESITRTSRGDQTLQIVIYTWYGKYSDLEVVVTNYLDHRNPQVMFYSGRDLERSLRIRKHLTAQIISRWPKAQIYGPTDTGRAGGPTPGPPLRGWE